MTEVNSEQKSRPRTRAFSWKTFRINFSKVRTLDDLKAELARLGKEIQDFNFYQHLSPSAKKRLKTLEREAGTLLKKVKSIESRIEKELSALLKQLNAKQKRGPQTKRSSRAGTTQRSSTKNRTPRSSSSKKV